MLLNSSCDLLCRVASSALLMIVVEAVRIAQEVGGLWGRSGVGVSGRDASELPLPAATATDVYNRRSRCGVETLKICRPDYVLSAWCHRLQTTKSHLTLSCLVKAR